MTVNVLWATGPVSVLLFSLWRRLRAAHPEAPAHLLVLLRKIREDGEGEKHFSKAGYFWNLQCRVYLGHFDPRLRICVHLCGTKGGKGPGLESCPGDWAEQHHVHSSVSTGSLSTRFNSHGHNLDMNCILCLEKPLEAMPWRGRITFSWLSGHAEFPRVAEGASPCLRLSGSDGH